MAALATAFWLTSIFCLFEFLEAPFITNGGICFLQIRCVLTTHFWVIFGNFSAFWQFFSFWKFFWQLFVNTMENREKGCACIWPSFMCNEKKLPPTQKSISLLHQKFLVCYMTFSNQNGRGKEHLVKQWRMATSTFSNHHYAKVEQLHTLFFANYKWRKNITNRSLMTDHNSKMISSLLTIASQLTTVAWHTGN